MAITFLFVYFIIRSPTYQALHVSKLNSASAFVHSSNSPLHSQALMSYSHPYLSDALFFQPPSTSHSPQFQFKLAPIDSIMQSQSHLPHHFDLAKMSFGSECVKRENKKKAHVESTSLMCLEPSPIFNRFKQDQQQWNPDFPSRLVHTSQYSSNQSSHTGFPVCYDYAKSSNKLMDKDADESDSNASGQPKSQMSTLGKADKDPDSKEYMEMQIESVPAAAPRLKQQRLRLNPPVLGFNHIRWASIVAKFHRAERGYSKLSRLTGDITTDCNQLLVSPPLESDWVPVKLATGHRFMIDINNLHPLMHACVDWRGPKY